jgi:hypothetical protein
MDEAWYEQVARHEQWINSDECIEWVNAWLRELAND